MKSLRTAAHRALQVGLVIALMASLARAAGSDSAARVLKDIPYKTGASLSDYERTRCKLDLYLPAKSSKDFPVVVWFHGGGLTAGDKSSAAPVAQRLADDGIAVACVNYRLSPRAKYPSYNQDAAASVAWAHAHIASYGGDVHRLFIAGHSAGGYLAGIVGYDPALLAADGMKSSQIAGLILVAPQVFTHFTIRRERGIPHPETTPVIDNAAPTYHVRKDAPPTLILLGDHDWPVRLQECQYFVAMLKYVGDPDIALRVIPHRTHGTIESRMADQDDPALKLVLEFVHGHATTQPSDH
jgi:acetyl esterase/lipase